MTVLTRIGRSEAIGYILNGGVFEYEHNYYLATDDNDKEKRRICVNVETGEVEAMPTGIMVETFDNVTIDITGRGVKI